MDISDALSAEQEELFYALAPKMFGDAVLVSHAIVRQWDRDNPATLSPAAIGRLRGRLAETLLITDDMQMQGLQKALGTRAASLRSLAAGIDMLCIGNNLFDQEARWGALPRPSSAAWARKRWTPPPLPVPSIGSANARPCLPDSRRWFVRSM